MKKINKKQVWKFFLQQKLEELKNFIFYTLLVGVGFYLLNFFGRWLDFNINGNDIAKSLIQDNSNNFVAYILYGLFGLTIFLIIIVLIKVIYDFLRLDWEKAEEKARSGK